MTYNDKIKSCSFKIWTKSRIKSAYVSHLVKVVRGKCGALTVQRGVNHCIIETSSSLDHNGQIKLVSMKGFGPLEIGWDCLRKGWAESHFVKQDCRLTQNTN